MDDEIGKKFGRLLIVGIDVANRHNEAMVLCECECGIMKSIRLHSIKSGNTSSCGCLRKENGIAKRKGKFFHKKEYYVWNNMRRRCYEPSNKSWEDYGGRGITVCDRWKSFDSFIEDMGSKPEGMSLERTDNNLGYSPSNCVWATRKRQSNNRRNNIMVHMDGITATLKETCDRLGKKYKRVHCRIKKLGWTIEKSLTT